MTDKEFPTSHVATAACEISLGEDISPGVIKEIASHVLGYAIWSHELCDQELWQHIGDIIRRQFPLLPTHEQASVDWVKAGADAVAIYGPSMVLKAGNEVRTEHPATSLTRMTGMPVIAIVVGEEKP